jgi:predicted CDP-diglyceride synthetase/phosphatidate cytidylyltransferase
VHSLLLAFLIPVLVAIGAHTVTHLETDLGIDRSCMPAGGGRIVNSIKSLLYTAPVSFHYLRYVLEDF